MKSKKHLLIKLDYHHSKNGYYYTWVRIGGRRSDARTIRVSVAKAVAECWLGPKPDGYEIDHIDRDSYNNDYRNLRYVTRSEQMKNRDHSRIVAQGKLNLLAATKTRSIPVKICKDNHEETFESCTDCARYLANLYGKTVERIRGKLKSRRSHIYDYDIIYLNAETGHAHSTE